MPPPETELLERFDQRVYLRFDWAGFETFLRLRGDTNANRITYLDGTLEIMSPSTTREVTKTRIARLLEAWAEEQEVELDGYGSWTIKDKAAEVGVEPDECYLVGHRRAGKRPDIAIEVVVSHGLNKLEVYRRLRVPEAWVWEDGVISVHRRGPRGYSVHKRSALLPSCDLELIARFAQVPNQLQAVKAFRAALRKH